MLQIDGSPYQWLGTRLPPCVLLAAIDDATSEVFALLRPSEDCYGYLSLLHSIVQARGLPQILYADRHTIFRVPTNTDELGHQLDGTTPLTQFGRATHRLGIRLIHARSPQAKGRVERLFGTLQDRLTKELALRDITSISEANAFLPGFLEHFNATFRVDPADPHPAWNPSPPAQALHDALAFQFDRVVRNDHTIAFAGAVIDLPPNLPRSLAKKTIQVRLHLDGTTSLWDGLERLADGPTLTGEPSPDTKNLAKLMPLRPKPTKPPHTAKPPREPTIVRPAKDHPWRKFRLKGSKAVLSSPTSTGG